MGSRGFTVAVITGIAAALVFGTAAGRWREIATRLRINPWYKEAEFQALIRIIKRDLGEICPAATCRPGWTSADYAEVAAGFRPFTWSLIEIPERTAKTARRPGG